MTPNLGWIPPSERTSAQEQAHIRAVQSMVKFAIAGKYKQAGKVDVRLYQAWWHPLVVADIGFRFNRFHQLTGSCVGAGGGNAMMILIALQRLFATNPTKAFVLWWAYNYGRSRYLMGDRNKGEGSMGSTFAKSLTEDGSFDAGQSGLPKYENGNEEGLMLTEDEEMDWSDGDSSLVTKYTPIARQHILKSAAEVNDTNQMADAIINGYPLTFACSRFIGNPREKSGVLLGTYDSNGGHQTSISAVRDHPTLGRLFGSQNNWTAGSYPKNPEPDQPDNYVWVTEAEQQRALRYEAEVFALSNFPWFPAQPDIAIPWIV